MGDLVDLIRLDIIDHVQSMQIRCEIRIKWSDNGWKVLSHVNSVQWPCVHHQRSRYILRGRFLVQCIMFSEEWLGLNRVYQKYELSNVIQPEEFAFFLFTFVVSCLFQFNDVEVIRGRGLSTAIDMTHKKDAGQWYPKESYFEHRMVVEEEEERRLALLNYMNTWHSPNKHSRMQERYYSSGKYK